MDVEFTPRFNWIDSAKKNLLDLEDKKKRKGYTSKNLSNYKNLYKKKIKNHKRCKSSKCNKASINNINIITKNKLKEKFILRNDFDKEHCKIFLKEKFLYLEKPILYDEICN